MESTACLSVVVVGDTGRCMQGLSLSAMRSRRFVVTAKVLSALEVCVLEDSVSLDACLECFYAKRLFTPDPLMLHTPTVVSWGLVSRGNSFRTSFIVRFLFVSTYPQVQTLKTLLPHQTTETAGPLVLAQPRAFLRSVVLIVSVQSLAFNSSLKDLWKTFVPSRTKCFISLCVS